MVTPIEDTVPEVSEDVDADELAEVVDELATMNSDDWSPATTPWSMPRRMK